MGKSYLLPVAGNPDPKQMTYLKHPLQDFLRRVLGGWVMVKLERNQQALIITGYDGPKERLYDAISRKAQVHARTTGIALDVSHLEEIVEGRDVQPAIETDETLRMDIEVLYSLLSDESKQREEAEKQHREELSKAEGQLKFVVRERDSAREQCEPLQKKLSGADKANRGLATNYLREKQRADELEGRIAGLEKAAKTPEELRIDAVRKSAQYIKTFEQELQALGISDLKNVIVNTESLVDYVNANFLGGAGYKTDEEVRAAANFRPALPDTGAELAYALAKKDIKFYDVVKNSGAEVPEGMQALFAALEAVIGEKRKIVLDYESAQEQAKEQQAMASQLQKLVEMHTTVSKAKALLEKLPPVEIYSAAPDSNGWLRIYVPVGAKDSSVYNLAVECFKLANFVETLVDEDGVVMIDTAEQLDGELCLLKAGLASHGLRARILVENEL